MVHFLSLTWQMGLVKATCLRLSCRMGMHAHSPWQPESIMLYATLTLLRAARVQPLAKVVDCNADASALRVMKVFPSFDFAV